MRVGHQLQGGKGGEHVICPMRQCLTIAGIARSREGNNQFDRSWLLVSRLKTSSSHGKITHSGRGGNKTQVTRREPPPVTV
jgi:hypothetical protein